MFLVTVFLICGSSNDGQVLIGHGLVLTLLLSRYIIPACFFFDVWISLSKQSSCILSAPKAKRSAYVCGSYLRFGLNRAFCSLFCAYCGQAVDVGGWIL